MADDDLLQHVAERLRARERGQLRAADPKTVYEWAKEFRRIDGQTFTLENFKPLQALYEDDWDRIVVMKPAQRGVSEYAICLTCYALEYGALRWSRGRKTGLNVGIVFPAKGDLIDFSKERLSNLKDETSHLARMFGGEEFDALGFKKVGNSFLYLRGGYSKAGLRSFPCDLLILDEYDELSRPAVALARRRLNAPTSMKREVMISTPSIPGRGISAEYLASDQRVYQTRCGACSTWNNYDFFRDVRVGGAPWDDWQKWSQARVATLEPTIHCPNCSLPQSKNDLIKVGRWVTMQPNAKRTHGYHIPWWPFVNPTLEQLVLSAVDPEPSEVEEFYHSDLGLPHGAGDGGITDDMLAQCSATLPQGLPDGPWRDTTMGVDIGSKLHYRISSLGPDNAIYVRDMGTTNNWEELDGLMNRFHVRQAVVDAEPEWHASQEFCDKWQGRAVRSFYATGVAALKGTLFHQKTDTNDLQVNRVMALDTIYQMVYAAREKWPSKIALNPEVIAQMVSSARIKLTDEKTGQSSYDWVHAGPDHFMHASAYDCIARKMLPVFKNQMPAVGGVRPTITETAVASRPRQLEGPSRFTVIR